MTINAARQRGNDIGSTGEAVASRLRQLRQEAGIDLRTMSERLTALGRPISLSALSKIENLQRRIDVDDLAALARALGVTVAALIGRDDTGSDPAYLAVRREVRAELIAQLQLDQDARGVATQVADGFAQGIQEARKPVATAASRLDPPRLGYTRDEIAEGIARKARRAIEGVEPPRPNGKPLEGVADLDQFRRSKAATITRTDAARLLGCDPRTITAGIAAGTIPAIRIGRRVMIPREPFLALLTKDSDS